MDDQAIQKAEKIDRFLQRKMTHDEQKAFEYQLAQDVSLREALENTDIARQAIRHHGLRMEVQDIRERMIEEEKASVLQAEANKNEHLFAEESQSKGRTLSFYQYSYRIAASLVLVFVSFIAIQMVTVSPEGLYASKMELNVSNDVTRGKSETASQTAILDAYRQSKFEQAISIYTELDTPTLIERYFVAAAYLQLNQYNNAISTYQQILANDQEGENEFLQQESSYKLAITYIRQSNYDDALPILEELDEHYEYYDNLIGSSFLWKLRLLRFKDGLLR